MRRRDTGLVQTSWDSCVVRRCPLQLWELCASGSPDGTRGRSGLGAFLACVPCIREPVPWSLAALSSEAEDDPSGDYLPTDEISRLQGVMQVTVPRERTVETSLGQTVVIFNRSSEALGPAKWIPLYRLWVGGGRGHAGRMSWDYLGA